MREQLCIMQERMWTSEVTLSRKCFFFFRLFFLLPYPSPCTSQLWVSRLKRKLIIHSGYIVPFPEAEKIFTYLQGETQEKLTDMTIF